MTALLLQYRSLKKILILSIELKWKDNVNINGTFSVLKYISWRYGKKWTYILNLYPSQGLTGLQRPNLHDGLTSAYHPKNNTQLLMTVTTPSCPILRSKNTRILGLNQYVEKCDGKKLLFYIEIWLPFQMIRPISKLTWYENV